MTQEEIQRIRTEVERLIDRRRLRDAISRIKETAHRVMAWEVEDKVKLTEQNYALMLKYLTQGAADPDRKDVYDSLVAEIYALLDALVCYVESVDKPTLYYSTIRCDKLSGSHNHLTEKANEYRSLCDQLSLFAQVSASANPQTAERQRLERLQSECFRYIWARPSLTSEDKHIIESLISDAQLPESFRQQTVSAVTLGLMQRYDRRRLQLLMGAYLDSPSLKVSSAALVGMLLGLWMYRNRPLTRPVADMLMAVKDKPSWSSDLRIAFLEMIRARDTERINRKMQDEVIPRMQKIRPDMMSKINDGSLNDDPAAMQENPEWQELLDKSGITDQLKELTEIQMEGGDVMMSTFAHLKQFPFFTEIANWFLPFEASHSQVADTLKSLDVLGDMMENAQFLCDSDKYSFIFAINGVPAAQRNMMVSQMQAQRDTIYEAMSAALDKGTSADMRRLAVNAYMQNIYRFYKLFNRRSEFFDPFDTGVNLIATPALSDDFSDTEMLQVVAEFYFKLQYLDDALNVFERLEMLTPGDAPRYQKMGYCHERLGHTETAIEYYRKAELLDSRSAWTVRRMAACLRANGQHAEAIEYYRRLSEMKPDDLKCAMLYGQALAENGDLTEAIGQFYKVEFLDEKSTRVWRPLAWTLFITGDYENAQKYYRKIILDNPTPNDYLNMGHVALATGNMREAVNNYTLSIEAKHGDTEWFLQALNADIPSLKKAGADASLIPLIADAALYEAK